VSAAAGEPAAERGLLLAQELQGGAWRIEALLQERPDERPAFVAVVCHPHPLYGGTLHNKVVHRVASSLFERHAAVLRFNFRGVGKSEGVHDRGHGELDDARAALAWIRARHPGVPAWCAGFSFGSWVASRVAAAEPAIERLWLVAPPVHTQTFEEMRVATVPKHVFQGTADDVCKPENIERVFPSWAEPKRLVWIEGASHFFDRKIAELGEALARDVTT